MRPSALPRATQGCGCVARISLPSRDLKDPRARGGRFLALCCSQLRAPNGRDQGLPGSRQIPCRVPSHQPQPRSSDHFPSGTAPDLPRHNRGAPGAAERAGCGPRRARGLGRSAAPGTRFPARPNLSAPASASAGGERDPPPFHFAPVRGNLRSVTRILKRATCSAGRAALGGIAGLGRRGLGTPGSGGHAGVGTPWRPAAAAR